MIIMGCDASSEGFGIAIMDDNKLLFKTTLKRNKGLTEWEHLNNIYKYLNETVKKFLPQQIILEDIYVGNNATTVKLLGTLRGIVHSVSFNANIPLYIYHTMTMKSIISKQYPQYTKIPKEKLKFLVYRIITNEFCLDAKTTTDETDAIAIILTHLKKATL